MRDYFDKAGLLNQLDSVVVTGGVNSRSVSATASLDVNMMFMPLLGIDSMSAPASGTAIENVSDIEIILVLDVSGSMGANSKLVNLQDAAREFVTTVLTPDIEERISIAIVPFNGQVNLGSILRARYNISDLHGVANANCVDLPAAAYATSDLSTTLSMPQTAHVDSFSSTNITNNMTSSGTLPSANTPAPNNRWCPPSSGNIVRLPTRSITTLHNHINGLHAVGATSINAGMRWGMELLDPGSRPMFNTLISGGHIPAIFTGRPYDLGRENTQKLVVLMTDGEHFAEERVNAGFRSGLAPIYLSSGDGHYSFHYPPRTGTTDYWVPHRLEWRSTPWNSGGGVSQQTWPQVWANVRMKWVAWQLYARAIGTTTDTRNAAYTNQMDLFRTLTPVENMNSQLQGLCGMARTNGIVVYGIAFEAPAGGQAQIYGCSSSPSHYYDAIGRQEISDAFQSIALQIGALRLIQ